MKGIFLALSLATFSMAGTLRGQVPQLISYQGRVTVGGAGFHGSGQFKFALMNGTGTTTYWSNDGTSAGGSAPTNAVSLLVTNGLYSVLLGDTTLANMTAIPISVFNTSDVRLRVWFNDGVNGFQLLAPDQRIAAVGYAMVAANVPDGAINSNQIAAGAINSTHLASASINAAHLVVASAPASGQVLGYNGTGLAWTAPGGGGDGIWTRSGINVFNTDGNIGIGTGTPAAKLDVRGHFVLDAGGSPVVYTGTANAEQNRFVQLINSTAHPSASGLKAGGVLVSDSYAYGSPGKNDLIVKGSVGIGTASPSAPLHIDRDWSPGDVPNVKLTGRKPTVQWSASPGFPLLGQTYSWIAHVGDTLGLEFWTRHFDGSTFPLYDSGWLSRVTLTREGDINYVGKLGKLDTTEQFSATVRAADFFLGHSGRRGTPGRALVDLQGALVLNFASDWAETIIGGSVTEVRTLRITGGADLAEPFAMSERDVPPGAVVVIDERHPGKLRMSDTAFDRKVAGIVSGADGIRPGISMIQEDALEAGENVALSGRVRVRANASGGPIESGDLLTTSDVPGEAMKAWDHDRAQGAILGKAMTGLLEGSGTVLVLVTLQ